MSWKSTPDRYGSVAIAIHWVTAILIIGLIIAGFIAADTPDSAAKASILRVHAPLGAAVLALTIFRIFWWQFADKKPASVGAFQGIRKWRRRPCMACSISPSSALPFREL